MRSCRYKKCFKDAAPGRSMCYMHRSRLQIRRHPVRYIWHWIKKSAKKRGLEFNLPFDKFEKLIIKSGYIENSGRKLKNFNIDRIDGSKGYTLDNIQVITKKENLKKYHHNDDLPF